MKKTRKERLSDRSVAILNKGGEFYLKNSQGWYLGAWTNIAAGPDEAHWSKGRNRLPIFNLEWAFALAPLYDCKVVARYPKPKAKPVQQECVELGPISPVGGGDPSYNLNANGSKR